MLRSAVNAAILQRTMMPPRVRPVQSGEREQSSATAAPPSKKPRIDHRAVAASVSVSILATRDPGTGWITGLWEHAGKNRLYQVDLCQDIFGEWLQLDTWWRKGTAFGGSRRTYLGFDLSSDRVRDLFYDASLRRSRHGYQVIDWRSFRGWFLGGNGD